MTREVTFIDLFKEHTRYSGGHWQGLIEAFQQISGTVADIPNILPVLPMRDVIAFPNLSLSLLVAREKSIQAVEYALKQEKLVFLIAQKEVNIENPSREDIYSIGTIGVILRTMRAKDTISKMKVLVQGICRASILEIIQTEPFLKATLKKHIPIEESHMSDIEPLILTVKDNLNRLVFKYGKTFPIEVMAVLENLHDPEQLAYLIASNLDIEPSKAQQILEIEIPLHKLTRINGFLAQQIISLAEEIYEEMRTK